MGVKADPAAQLKLLDVQALDARADRLRHQRVHLPELAEIAALEQARREVDDQRRDQQIVVDDLRADQRKADVDVETVRTRRTRDRDRMDQGLITNPKDLERMRHELDSLERRISVLEDEELEVMEQLEHAEDVLDSLATQVGERDVRLGELTAARDQKVAAVDAELATVTAERGPTAEGLPEDLLALYEKLRAGKGGVGAAALRTRQCTGCSMALDNVEVATFRAADPELVLRHEECQRILVRTPESGL